MIIIDDIPHFDIKQAGIEYIPRPSVYAIIQNAHSKIAIVKHKGAFFLPGGGIEPGETPIEALQREIVEETGYQARDMEKCGEAVEYLQAVSDGKYYRIHSTFFIAQLETGASMSTEPDHQLIWMRPETAKLKMQRACHRWTIESFKIDEYERKIRESSDRNR